MTKTSKADKTTKPAAKVRKVTPPSKTTETTHKVPFGDGAVVTEADL